MNGNPKIRQSDSTNEKWKWWEYLLIGSVGLGFVGLVLGLLWFHYSTLKDLREHYLVENHGLPLKGTVLEKSYHKSTKGAETFSMKYEYVIEGKAYNDDRYIDGFLYSMNDEGDSLDILYLADKPWISDLPGNDGLDIQLIQLFLIDSLILVVFMVFIYRYFKEKREQEQNEPHGDSA